jgi:hypothetical protein
MRRKQRAGSRRPFVVSVLAFSGHCVAAGDDARSSQPDSLTFSSTVRPNAPTGVTVGVYSFNDAEYVVDVVGMM